MRHVDRADLEHYARRLLESIGTPEPLADDVATSLVRADLTGHRSHGVIRIPLYETMIADDAIEPAAEPIVSHEAGATTLVDGNDAFGQVVGRTAVDALVNRAHEHGVAVAGIRNAAHLGRMGEWGERVASEDLLFVATVNAQGGARTVAPAGSTERRFATNPVVYAVPTFDALPFPILIDVSTAQVAHGKIQEQESLDEPLPEGWAISPDGEPITAPEEVNAFESSDDRGAIQPLGGTISGYKGTGLSIAAELLAGIVADAPVVGQHEPRWFSNAAAFVAVDPLAFSSRAGIERKVASVAAHLETTPSHPDVSIGSGATGEELLLPGEPEYETARERLDGGIPIPGRVAESLGTLAAENGISSAIPPTLE